MRADEETAFAIVERVLGVQVEPYDVAGKQNAVDGLVHYPDGRTGVLEISSIGPPEEAAITAIVNKPSQRRYTVEGLTMSWSVLVPRDFRPQELKTIDPLLLLCEQHGAGDIEQLYPQSRRGQISRAIAEAVDAGVRAEVVPTPAGRPPEVRVSLRGVGGYTGDGETLLAAEVDEELQSDTMQGKLTKLGKDSHADRHLFLWVRPSAFSFAVTDNIYFGGPVPAGPPCLPGGLTELWLASSHNSAGGVIHAIHGDRWQRHHPYDT